MSLRAQIAAICGNTSRTGKQWRRQLAWRLTDEAVSEQTGLILLSVAADRMGLAAMRCAGLLGQMASRTEGWIVLPTAPLSRLI